MCVVDGADGAVYAIVLAGEGEDAPPAEVVVPGVTCAADARIEMLGAPGALAWKQRGADIVVELPAALPCAHAWGLRIPG